MTERNEIYINLLKEWNGKSFVWKAKDGTTYLIIQAKEEKYAQDRTVYWLLGYKSEETYKKKLSGERVDADIISAIKERDGKDGSKFYSGTIFNNKDKQAFFVNLYTPAEKREGVDLLLKLTQTEYREFKPKDSKITTDF